MKLPKVFLLTSVLLLTLYGSLGIAILPVAAVVAPAPTFANPLGSLTIYGVLTRVILWLLGISAFLALLALIWGGLKYITSFVGGSDSAKEAKQIILWALIGLAVIGLSYVIVRTVPAVLGVPL